MTKTCPRCKNEINMATCLFGVYYDEHAGKIVVEVECDMCNKVAYIGCLDPAEMDAQ